MASTRRKRHLTVVHSAEREHAAMLAALRQIAGRVPHRTQRVYDWHSESAENLFMALSTAVENLTPMAEIEDNLDMPGLSTAYLEWLGRQM